VRPVQIGCSGWAYRAWRGVFYPEGVPQSRWLSEYAAAFSTVELNTTFYRLARPESARRWVEQTPEEFVFAAKASRYLTHMKRLTDLSGGVGRFYDSIEPLVAARRLGPVIWQLPENFRRDDERLAAALDAIADLPPRKHAFEFRHESWFVPEVERMLHAHNAALVIGDHPGRRFQTHALTATWTLIRFHYGHRGRGGNYSDAELREWAARLRDWRERVEVFAYFNNDMQGFATRNATRLRQLLGV
jgi:uncharacterized protein YecE (DUF72 family)